MKWGNDNKVVATPEEAHAISTMMNAFHGVRFQIGGPNPSGGCYALPDDAVVVWVDLAFFVLYKINDAGDNRFIFVDATTSTRTMRLPGRRRAIFLPNR